MESTPKIDTFFLARGRRSRARQLFVSQPEQAQTLSLLYEISHELTSILDRQELLRRVAERVKKLVDYHVFSVLLWNEPAQMLESVFSMRFQDAIPSRVQMPLAPGHHGSRCRRAPHDSCRGRAARSRDTSRARAMSKYALNSSCRCSARIG